MELKIASVVQGKFMTVTISKFRRVNSSRSALEIAPAFKNSNPLTVAWL